MALDALTPRTAQAAFTALLARRLGGTIVCRADVADQVILGLTLS
jgi:hypothetical protein